MQSIVKSLSLLFAIAESKDPVSAASLASTLDLPRPTVYRHLETLVAEGLVARLANGFVVTPKLALKVTGARPPIGLRHVAIGNLNRLVAHSGETASLHVRSGTLRCCVAEVEGVHGLRWARGVGFTAPIWSGAVGHVLLGGVDDAQIDEMLASADLAPSASNSCTDPVRLKELALEAQEQGWSGSANETVEGACAIAAPIHESSGRVIAAMGLYAPSTRYEHLMESVDLLLELAAETSAEWAKVSGIDEIGADPGPSPRRPGSRRTQR